MNRLTSGILLLALCLPPIAAGAQERAIRRTVPITRAFERGLSAGVRDSSGQPAPGYWQLRTDYRIDARLDPPSGSVTGIETVTITNPSDSALRQVVIRLYQNLFAPSVPRSVVAPDVTDGMILTRVVINGEDVDLSKVAAQAQRSTILRLPVATPIPAGGTGRIEIDWSFRVPDIAENQNSERMGRWGTRLFQLAQWYPQVAVYDDLRGWNTDPYLGGSEFFNNFGSFDVHLDVPGGWLVGATGVLANPEEVLSATVRSRLAHLLESDSQQVIVGSAERRGANATAPGDRLIWHFTADSVADFAWASSNEYVWDATRATIPGRGAIPVHILYLPSHRDYLKVGPWARHALEFYSRTWMPYAFPVFTQVDGPENGMEYPMLTMSGPGFGVTDHEIGHQWWPMMVGNNETWYGWMDEGFNQYMNILSRGAYRGQPATLDSIGQRYGRVALLDEQAPMMWDANYGGPMYSFVTYGKVPMMFSMLGGIVGDSAVMRAMSVYAHTWDRRHPSPWDFMFLMNRELGQNLDWFWYYWLFTTEGVDGSIEKVEAKGRKTLVTVSQRGEMPSPVVLRVDFAAEGPDIKPMKNAVVEGNSATVTWPVDVWFDGRRRFVAELDFGKRKIERVTLDPQARFPDRDTSDNSWPR